MSEHKNYLLFFGSILLFISLTPYVFFLSFFHKNRNFMNDSLRTDVFVRYPPETIAVACIYLSARKLKEPLPKNPSWFNVLGVEEDDIKDCCYRLVLFIIYRLFFLRPIAQFFTQIYMNCFVSS